MGLAKRKTRLVTVDGVLYRWVVSPDDGYLMLVTELADAPGQRLEAFFSYHDTHEPAGGGALRIVGQRRSIRPGVIRRVIQLALARGWRPAEPGHPPFQFRDADELVPLE